MKLMIALPWYTGPDDNTFPLNFALMNYFGALRERSLWLDKLGPDKFFEVLEHGMPPLDETRGDDGLAEPTPEDWARLAPFQIGLANYSRCSLVGQAREMVVDASLDWDADGLLWWDSDMRFEYSAFLRLWRHKQPVVGALAFTAREPFHPVIYRIRMEEEEINGELGKKLTSDVVFKYPKNQLIGNDEIGGELAFGAGVMYTDVAVFKEIPKPWFKSTGCGEDWFFCHRCSHYGIPRHVDTGVKSQHKQHAPRWSDESTYEQSLQIMPQAYENTFGPIEDWKSVVDHQLAQVKVPE